LSSGQAPALLAVAGEASADMHGAKVLSALSEIRPGVEFFGLGGSRMKAAGLHAVADSDELNVVGISEVFKGLAGIRRVFNTLLAETGRRKPAAALLMDLPDFNLRLARRLKKAGVPVVYYLAPQAWAWRRGRVRQIRRRVEHLCVVFPFEEKFFSGYGVPAEFVGHPLCEDEIPERDPDPGKILLLPGSRRREIQRLLPSLVGAARLLKESRPDLRFVLPLAGGLDRGLVQGVIDESGLRVELSDSGARAELADASLALAASGTVTLEAALASVPLVVVYRVSRTTYTLVRPFFRLDHVCIVNILAGRELVPELLQGNAKPRKIAQAAIPLLEVGDRRQGVLDGYRDIVASLGKASPSRRVAEILDARISREPE